MEQTHLNVLLEIIVNSYFSNSRCVLILTDNANQINIQTAIPFVYFKGKLDSERIFQNYGCRDIMLGHDDPSGFFEQFETLLNGTNERFNTRKYVVFSRRDGAALKAVFATHHAFFSGNILVIAKDSDDSFKKGNVMRDNNETYSLFTNSFYSADEFEFLDKWFSENSSFLHGANLFPDKLWDQHGRNLTIGSFTFVPYTVLERDDDNHPKSIDGSEMNLAMEFVKKHNMTANFVNVEQYDWGVIYENWTGTGLFKGILEDTTDVVLAALYTWEALWNYTDFSKTLSRAGVNCLVPAPKRATGLTTPFLSFSAEMWIGVLITFLLNVVVICFILKYESTTEDASVGQRAEIVKAIDKSITTLIRIYLLQSFDQVKGGKVMVSVISVILLYVVLLATSYGGGLASVMVIPRYEHPIQTLWDLKDAGIEWGAPNDDYWLIIKDYKEEPYASLLKKSVMKPAEELRKISFEGTFGYIIERLQYGYFTIPTYIERDVISNYRSMREDVYYAYCHLMLKKHSVLTPLIDRLIFQLFESGIPGYWESQGALLYSDMIVQRSVIYYRRNVKEHEIVKLNWSQVEGAFAMLLAGWVVAFVVFLGEILVEKIKSYSRNNLVVVNLDNY